MLLIFPLVFGIIGAMWAQSKNLNALIWGLVCFFLPALGLIILAFQKPVDAQASESFISSQSPGRYPKVSATSISYDVNKWNALVEYDPDIRQANEYAAQLGPRYTEILAQEYFKLNDKAYLSPILDKLYKLYEDNAKNSNDLDGTYFSGGLLGDVNWTYYSEGFYVGEQKGENKRLRILIQ